jgi:arylsulfatase A-like enzyme
MRMPSMTLCVAATAMLLSAAVEGYASGGVRPNVLLLVSDDQRPDTIAALGNRHIRTPTLDQLVARGTAFLRATCANPICTPSRAEIMTGCSGFRNGVLDFGDTIRPGTPRWAETMRTAGYRTFYVGKWHNDGRPRDHGYDQSRGLFFSGGPKRLTYPTDHAGRAVTGYTRWVFQSDDGTIYPEKGVGLTPEISDHIAAAAIDLIKQTKSRPFFLHVNFTAPHDPLLLPPRFETAYDPQAIPLPPNFLEQHPFDHGNLRGRDEKLWPWPRTEQDVRSELAAYYAVIAHMDQQIGRILTALEDAGEREETLVIFTSDHGLAIGSHGLRGKQNMYDHTIGVPLIFAGPGVPGGTKNRAQCYLRDLFPTVCDLVGVAWPESVEGRSLAPVIRGKQESIYPAVFGYFRNSQRMIRTDRWKLIHYPSIGRYQLFDLMTDPNELHDVSGDGRHKNRFEQLQARLNVLEKTSQ